VPFQCRTQCRASRDKPTARAAATLAAAAATIAVTMRADDHVPEHLLCCGCLDAPTGRVEQCANGHLLCAEYSTREGTARTGASCLPKLRAQVLGHGRAASCPACRCPLPRNLPRSFVAEETIALLPTTCRYCAERRAWRLSLATHHPTDQRTLHPRGPGQKPLVHGGQGGSLVPHHTR